MWTRQGVRIIDFNVAVQPADGTATAAARAAICRPTSTPKRRPQPADLADRDLYALGVTLYEAMTGRYPWADLPTPPPGVPHGPLTSSAACRIWRPPLSKSCSRPSRRVVAERFASAADLKAALDGVRGVRPAARPCRCCLAYQRQSARRCVPTPIPSSIDS